MSNIFISYRRTEHSSLAINFARELKAKYKNGNVFLDSQSIEPGELWPDQISKKISEASIILVLIGEYWIGDFNQEGELSRISNPDDWVRREIELALSLKKYIIPILVNGAKMPLAHVLPNTIDKIVNFQAYNLRERNLSYNVDALIDYLQIKFISAKSDAGKEVPNNLTPLLFVSKSFYGRKGELTKLEKILNSPTPVALIKGIGGIGKTSIAEEYIKYHLNEYEYVAWIRVSEYISDSICSNSSLTSSLRGLGQHGFEENVREGNFDDGMRKIFDALSSIGKTLVVIDSANDYVSLGENYEQFFRFNTQLSFILTSRSCPQNWNKANVVNVPKLPITYCERIFKSHYKLSKPDSPLLKHLISKLDRNPLLIEFIANATSYFNIGDINHFLDQILNENTGGHIFLSPPKEELKGELLTSSILLRFILFLEYSVLVKSGKPSFLSETERVALSVFLFVASL